MNRVIMWCADKMPSVVPADAMALEVADAVAKGQAANTAVKALGPKRAALISKYMK